VNKNFLLIVGFLTATVYGSNFQGTGFGQTAKIAKHEALSDLSQTIKSEVQSTFNIHKSSTRSSADSASSQDIQISSNLPIIGAEFELFDNPKNIEALVTLNEIKAQKLYTEKLQTLLIEIKSYEQKIEKTKNSVELSKLLQLQLGVLNEYNRYKSVAIIVGVESIKKLPTNSAKIKSKLLALQSNIDSIAMASTLLATSFKKYHDIYLYPPKQSQSHEITPFAKAVKLELSPKLHTALYPVKASYYLIGEYSKANNGLVLNYSLLDVVKHETVASRTVVLQSKAYKNIRTEPKSISFDKLLHEGVVVSNDFKVSLATNKGSEDLLFTSGEELELMVKLNKRGYIYIVGYTQTESSKQAYLLELQEANSDAKFTQFINADDANKWISLGAFTVEAPFGIESIQVVASNKPIKQLPSHFYHDRSGYYLLEGKTVSESLLKTRGLLRKKPKQDVIVKSEAVLMFTTMKK
jgi:hypothetical protein